MPSEVARRLPETNRVEAFSDGVLAIAVTLLVLDLHSDFERGSFSHSLGSQWPAAVISAAQRDGNQHDQIAASLLYAGIGFLVPLTFLAIYSYLGRHPELLTEPAQSAYIRVSRKRALVSFVVYPLTAALAFVSTDLVLGLFLAVPLFFIISVFVQERSERADGLLADTRASAPQG